jgi:outer membrane receptor protein involved in Fe transport
LTRLFISILFLGIPFNVIADTNTDKLILNLLSKDLSALGELEVYSTSRSATDTDHTLGVVTVITAEEIARKGYNSVHEVMQNVPGVYYNNSSGFENLTSRGISQTLTSFLFLIDGHAVNNKSSFGISVETVFPILADVERIEVVRGPGTVLWGGEAGLGIIHVITKSGHSMDLTGEGKWETYADYMSDQDRRVVSTIYGKSYDDGDLMASFKYFDSGSPDGFKYSANAAGPKKALNSENNERRNANFDLDASYEFNLKGTWKDFNYRGSITNFNNYNYDNTQRTEASYTRNWLELGHSKELSDRSQIKSRFFFNDYELIYFHTRQNYNDNFRMRGGGLESIIYFNEENYQVTSGIYGELNFLDFLTGFSGNVAEQFEAAPNILDKQIALFSDWVYTGISDWQFNLGGRLQFSDGVLSDRFTFMPRASAVYEFNPDWTAKYLFSSSSVQPTLTTFTGGENGNTAFKTGAANPQRFNVHDLQLKYQNETTTVTSSLFYIEVQDMIIFSNAGDKRFDNGPDATSKGIQLELTHKLDKVKFYGDYTFALAEFDERTFSSGGSELDVVSKALGTESLRLLGTPLHQWNVGTDIELPHKMTLNLHHRGAAQILTRWTTGSDYRDLPTELFFDASLHWKDAGIKGVNTTLYVKNIGDNNAVIADTVNGGYVENILGRRIGFNLKYSF